MKLMQYLGLYSVFLLLAFPSFYFTYKFGDPEPLAHDFFQYYYLYKDFAISHVIAPHNMRLVGAWVVHLFYDLNFYYDTATAFDKYQSWGFLKQVYFNAIFFNYLCVAATSLVVFKLLTKHFQNSLLSFIGSLMYLLGFGTLFYELMPGTDAFSVLLFALAFYFYVEQKPWMYLVLLLLIFQREYALIVFFTIAFMDFLYFKKRYFLVVFGVSVLCFITHVVLRKTLFYTPHLDHQASIDFFWSSLFQINYDMLSYLKQLAMTLNLFYFYSGILIYKKWKNMEIDSFSFLKVLILFIQINLICHLAGHGTNCGRYFYLISPYVIYLAAKEYLEIRNASTVFS